MADTFTDSSLEEIRARIDIVELIGARMTLKKSGATYKGCCPFHREKTPSFHVNPTRQRYHCFGCGEDGDIFTFLMKQDGLPFMDAVRQLADRAGVTLRQEVDYSAQGRQKLYAIHAELAAFFQRCLHQTATAQAARDYLATRGLPDAVIKAFGIGYAPAQPRDALLQWARKYNYTPEQLVDAGILTPPNNPDHPDDFYFRFGGRLMFPICDRQGRVVAFSGRILDPKSHPAKYVNSPETEIFVKSRILYALDKAGAKIVKHPRREALVCEGQIDVIRCHACGFETAVASQGTAFTAEHVALLKKYADSVVLVFDGDNAGRKAALRTGALFLASEIPVRVVNLPKGDDPDSFLRQHGPTPFRELIDQAVSITAFQIATLTQLEASPNSIDALHRISHDVMEMLAACPSAIQRSRLAEEAAQLLHLPLQAFSEDLERRCEQLRQKAAYTARFHKDEPRDEAVPSENDAELEPLDRETDDRPLDLDVPPPPEPPSRTEFLLCEFLVEHEHDEAALTLMERYLPQDILRHTFTRAIMTAIFQQRKEGGDKLAELGGRVDPIWRPLLGTIIANKQKMLCASEATSSDAAQDLIRRLWIEAFQRTRDGLDATSPDSTAPRLTLSAHIVRLRAEPWERASLLMNIEHQFARALTPAADAHPPVPAASSVVEAATGYVADIACEDLDQEEFQPSASPPDGRPDS